MTTVRLGDRYVRQNGSCFVIAEVGVNHDGDVAKAHRLIDLAADAGADAVKFQTFDVGQLVAATAVAAPYQTAATGAGDQRTMLERLALPTSAWTELADHAETRGITFLSTPFDLESAALLVDLGVAALKIPSGELDNLPFIRAIAAFGLPVLISTGMGALEEIRAALEAAAGARGAALFQCVSAYPAPPRDANLRSIPSMAQEFSVPVGWSDHTQNERTAIAAVALGASLLEKHITLDRASEGPDHAASSDPDDFFRYVSAVRETETALGDGRKRPMPSEEANRVPVRRSLHASRVLSPGQVLQARDVVALRPAIGLPPATDIAKRRVRRHVDAGDPVLEDDLYPEVSAGGANPSECQNDS